MKGFISIEIPTKSYIKAYVFSQLGSKPAMHKKSSLGLKLFDVLGNETNNSYTSWSNIRYDTTLKSYISQHTFRQRSAFINDAKVKKFNFFIEGIIKESFRFYMDHYISIAPSFEAHLPEVRKHLGIDLEACSDDSMRKDYYRYGQYTGKALLHNKRPVEVTSKKIGKANHLQYGEVVKIRARPRIRVTGTAC